MKDKRDEEEKQKKKKDSKALSSKSKGKEKEENDSSKKIVKKENCFPTKGNNYNMQEKMLRESTNNKSLI